MRLFLNQSVAARPARGNDPPAAAGIGAVVTNQLGRYPINTLAVWEAGIKALSEFVSNGAR